MPNKINIASTPSTPSPKIGDIYRSGFNGSDSERFILCNFGFNNKDFYMLVSLRSGNYWYKPSENIQDAVIDAIFVGRDMTITFS